MSEEIVSGNDLPPAPRRLITKSEWARLHGFTPGYVTKLLKEQRIVEVQGKIDPADADVRLESSRKLVRTGYFSASAIRQRKNTELNTKNEWRGPVLSYVCGKDYVIVADVVRSAVNLTSASEKDTSRVASILRSVGWKQKKLQVGGNRGLVYVKPGWTPHKPQRTLLAEAILALRKHLGEKHTEFAERLNVAVGTISKYETTCIPSRHVLIRLRDMATTCGRNDLVSLLASGESERCATENCSSPRSEHSKYCEEHYRQRDRERQRARRVRRANDPVFTERRREKRKAQYWKDPETFRTRSQVFKHANPQHRARWDEKRGLIESECSDGTLTQDAVRELFGSSRQCPYCGDPYKKSRRSLDHIVPLSKADGRKLHSLNNVLVCCRSCNTKKHAKDLTQFLQEVKAAKRKNASGSTVSNAIPSLFECLAN